MKARLNFFILLSFMIFSSCLNDGEMAVEKNNTIIYFDHKEDEDLANKLLDFWIKNKHEGKEKQSLKISRLEGNKTLLLKVIVRESFKAQKMPFEDIKRFNDIQTKLNKEVFLNVPCQIAVCDKYFNVLTIPNKINP